MGLIFGIIMLLFALWLFKGVLNITSFFLKCILGLILAIIILRLTWMLIGLIFLWPILFFL